MFAVMWGLAIVGLAATAVAVGIVAFAAYQLGRMSYLVLFPTNLILYWWRKSGLE